MTLRLSPKQLDIITFLKAPGTTPESYAKAHFQSVKTVYVQLGRVKAKDKEARIFRAFINGMIGRYPQLRQWIKPQTELTPKEAATVENGLQNPHGMATEQRGKRGNVKKRGPHNDRKSHDSQQHKGAKRGTQKSVKPIARRR